MAIIVEDGSGLANSNSYVALSDANTYFTLRNNSNWLNADPIDAQTPALILAADYMYRTYRERWQGYRTVYTQAMDWPRTEVVNPNIYGGYGNFPSYIDMHTIPQEVKDAQCLLAVRYITQGDLDPDITPIQTSVQIGTLKVTYDPNSPSFTLFRAVDSLLDIYLEDAGSAISSRISRL